MSVSDYEFSSTENKLIGSLAGKMGFVGLLAVILGVVNLVLAVLVVAAVFRDRIPADWQVKTKEYLEQARDKLPADVRAQAEQYSLDKLPPNDHLWGIALGTGATGLFYLLMGVWTRAAAGSFRKIVDTRGSDIHHLMVGMESLHKMYSLLYTLLVVILLAGIVGIGLSLLRYFMG